MATALQASLLVALLLAFCCRAARPGGILAPTLGRAWQWWLIMRPVWLPDKPTGGCVLCTCFWVPGIPTAVGVAMAGGGGWALVVPPCVAILSEILILL